MPGLESTTTWFWPSRSRSGARTAIRVSQDGACLNTCAPTYGPAAVDRELTALPKPLEPIPPAPALGSQFGYSVAPKARPAVALVTLRAPVAVSSASGLSGRSYLPDAAGNFRVTAEDSRPLIANGWTPVAGQQA